MASEVRESGQAHAMESKRRECFKKEGTWAATESTERSQRVAL